MRWQLVCWPILTAPHSSAALPLERIVRSRTARVVVPLLRVNPPRWLIRPCRFDRLIRPPEIGKVNVVPDAEAGAIGAALTPAFCSAVAAALDRVSVVDPPVMWVYGVRCGAGAWCGAWATATPVAPSATRAAGTAALRRGRMFLLGVASISLGNTCP